MRTHATMIVLVGWLAASAVAQVPHAVNFQGRLINGSNLYSGTAGVLLELYTNSAGGDRVYADTGTTAVVDGLYSTLLGDDEAPFGDLAAALAYTDLWLQVTIDGTVLEPRQRMVSSAYALRADDASRLGGLSASQFATGAPLYVEASGLGWTVSVDAQTNYTARAGDGSAVYSNRSFSALMNTLIPLSTNGVINLGCTTIGGRHIPFEIDGPVVIGNNIVIRGQGYHGTAIICTNGYNGRFFVVTGGTLTFERIRINVIGASASTNACIDIVDCSGLKLWDCSFTGFSGPAVRYDASMAGHADSHIARCWFYRYDAPTPAIDLTSSRSSAYRIDGIQVLDNVFYVRTNLALRVAASNVNQVIFSGNQIFSSGSVAGGMGVQIQGGIGHIVSDNAFVSWTANRKPIVFDSATSNYFGAIVQGNTFEAGLPTNAVYIGAQSHGVRIYGNAIASSSVAVAGANQGGYAAENLAQGEAAYEWGDHAAAGYLKTNQVVFGGYEAKAVGTEYQAPADGFAIFSDLHNYDSGGVQNVQYTLTADSAAPATTVRAVYADRSGGTEARGSLMVPVPAGYYWKAARSSGTNGVLWWLPVSR